MPSRSLSREDLDKAAETHSKRTLQAQRVDEAMKARIAESLDQWLADPARHDIPGVDYPGISLQKALDKMKEKNPSQVNPFKNSSTTKEYIKPIMEEYLKVFEVQPPKLSAVNRGHPAKIQHYEDTRDPVMQFNYKHFQQVYEELDDPDLVDKYLHYAVAHELAHRQQEQEMGYQTFKQFKEMSLQDFELDADQRAATAMNTDVKDIQAMIEEMEEQLIEKDPDRLMRPKDKPPVTKAQKPLEPHPDSLKYREIPVDALEKLPGIGPVTIKNLEKFGYHNLGKIYSDSAQLHGLLAQTPGIGEHTAQELHKRIDQHFHPKPRPKPKPESYTVYNDPGHGWLRVPVKKLEELGIANEISHLSYRKGQYAYLEEDKDARIFTDTLASKDVEIEYNEHHSENRSSIRNYDPYHGPRLLEEINTLTRIDSVDELEQLKENIPTYTEFNEYEKNTLQKYADTHLAKLQRKTPDHKTIHKAEPPPQLDPEIKQLENKLIQLKEKHDHLEKQWEKDVNYAGPAAPRTRLTETEKEIKKVETELKSLKDAIKPTDIPTEWNKWLEKATDTRDLDTLMIMLDRQQDLTEPQKTRITSLIEQKRSNLKKTVQDINEYETYLELVDNMYPRGNIPQTKETLKENILHHFAEKKSIDIDDPKTQYAMHTLENIKQLSSQMLDTLIESGYLEEHDTKYYISELPRIKRSIDPEQVEETMRSLIANNPDTSDEEILNQVVETYNIEPEAVDSFKTLAQNKLDNIKQPPQDQLNQLRRAFKKGYRESLEASIDHQIANTRNELYDSLIDKKLEQDQVNTIMAEFNEETILKKHRELLNELQDEYLDQCHHYLSKASTDPITDWKRAVELDRWRDAAYQHAAEVVKKEYHNLQTKAKPRTTKHTKTPLIRPTGTKKRKEYYAKTQPLTYLASIDCISKVKVENDTIHIIGMDPRHICLNISRIPNHLGIPDGEYGGHLLTGTEMTKSLIQYPDKIEWKQQGDSGEIHFTKESSKGHQHAAVKLDRGEYHKEEIPEPRIIYKAKAKSVDLKKFKELVDTSMNDVIHLKTLETDEATELIAYWNEERAEGTLDPVSHTMTLSKDIKLENPVETSYSKNYLAYLLEALLHQGTKKGSLELSTDMPLKLTTHSPDFSNEHHLAPLLDHNKSPEKYYPDDPRQVKARKDYPSKEAWRNQAIPYTAAIHVATSHGRGEPVINATQDHLSIKVMNGEHTAMLEIDTPNLMGIEPGEYKHDYDTMEPNKTTLRYPDKLIWDPETHQLQAVKKNDRGYIDLEPGDATPPPPLPEAEEAAILYGENLEKLRKAVNQAWKATKTDFPSIHLESTREDIVIRYIQDGTEKEEKITPTQITPGKLDTSIDPELLRDYLYLLENMNPEHITIKQHATGVLVIETIDQDTILRYGVAPQIGA